MVFRERTSVRKLPEAEARRAMLNRLACKNTLHKDGSTYDGKCTLVLTRIKTLSPQVGSACEI